jgi:predicted RNA-binding protein
MKLYTAPVFYSSGSGDAKMCEFKVILDGKTVFRDAVSAKTESDKVIVKDMLGKSKEFKDCKITEVNVNSTRLVLSSQ